MRRREFVQLAAGATMTWPLRARAQQKPIPVIGFLASRSPSESALLLAAFHQGLGETGYIEGQSVVIEYRWAEDHYDRLPELAADLVGRKVDLIVASGGVPAALAAKDATAAIPIVFTDAVVPAASGLIAGLLARSRRFFSLLQPGNNLTGVDLSGAEPIARRTELLLELVPEATVIALLVNPNNATAESMMREVGEAAAGKGMELHILKAGTDSEIDAACATFAMLHVQTLVVGHDPFISSRINQLSAAMAKIPPTLGDNVWRSMYEWRGLMKDTRIITLLVNPDNSNAERMIRDVQEAVGSKGAGLLTRKARGVSEIRAAFDAAQALLVGSDPLFDSRREQIVALASHRGFPAIYPGREFATSGGLMSYGPSRTAAYREAGIYAGRILKGARPADLPVQQPTTFELVINLKTAKALGLTVPQVLLAQADEVIE
jgi:putative ABC transport system substrate-binding protein